MKACASMCLLIGLALPPASALPASAASIAGAAPPSKRLLAKPPAVVKRLARQVLETHDNAGLPFVIIDKRAARVFVLSARGTVLGHAPVLLGSARGDDSVPGIGERPIAAIQAFERTTPAGRFVAAAGQNAKGEDIVWVDYDAAVSMHRVRAVNPAERRLERLASATPLDNRISYGCINVPKAFFDKVVAPLFLMGPHIVYILPEIKTLQAVFGLQRTANEAVSARPSPVLR